MNDLNYYRPDWIQPTDRQLHADICVYGGTSAGIIAAIKAKQLGKSVILLHPGKHLGGLTTGGLGWTDYGQQQVIGGLSREFYRRCGVAYGKAEEFLFEPHVATEVYDRWLAEFQISVGLCQYLDKAIKSGDRITGITLTSGLRVEAAMFIDATYEGDLFAAAGVSFTVGREGNDAYKETLNGIQVRHSHQFSNPVDPFIKEGDSDSGLLPMIVAEDLSQKQGTGDKRVQAYCFRMCMTDDPSLRIAWERPENYDPSLYVLAERWYCGPKDEHNDSLSEERHKHQPFVPQKLDILPNLTPGGHHKTDTNNHGPVSSDFIGGNHDWPTASYARREEIFQSHLAYQKGFYWFMANNQKIPARYREAYGHWGLASDEFQSTGHWPHSLYVREGRRMISDYVITEHDCLAHRVADDGVGMGSYGMDSHNCSRYVDRRDGKPRVMNEGDVQVGAKPYPISYRAITPKAAECTNLLVPVCLSSSHIAFGSARMEPVFMVLGESAAIAAHLAIEGKSAVQGVDPKKLRDQLLAAGQVLVNPGK